MNRSLVVITIGLAMVICSGAIGLAGPPCFVPPCPPPVCGVQPCAPMVCGVQPCAPPACAVPACAGPLCGPPCRYVATVTNFRGAMYLGSGPTPGHAAECAMAKCTQDSFFACSCKVSCMRAEALPMPPPVMMKQTSRHRFSRRAAAAVAQPMANSYSWGRPMP